MADKLGHAQHPLRRLAALLVMNSGHGFFRTGFSTAFSPGAVQFELAATRHPESTKPLENPDRRALGASFDLIS
jgi:hypothetical protein